MAKEQSRIRMINKLYVLNEIIKLTCEEFICERMVRSKELDNLTKNVMKIKNVDTLKYEMDGIGNNPFHTLQEQNQMLLYGYRRAYNFVLSKMCEHMLACLDFIEKENNEYNKVSDIKIFGIQYDVKLVDWNNGNPNYYCYRDYNQRKIWINYKSKTDLANPQNVKNLMDYVNQYLIDNKDNIITGRIKNIYIEGDKY